MARSLRLLFLTTLVTVAPAWGRPALRAIDPRVEPMVAPSLRGDRFELQLRPAAAHAARAVARTYELQGRSTQPRPALGVATVDRLAAALGGVTFEPEFRGEVPPPAGSRATDFTAFYIATLPVGVPLESALASFASLGEVASADPIAVLRVSAIPNDSLWSESWWFYDPPNRHDVHAPEAWDVTTGDTSVVVAIIDTGVLFDHPDLGGSIAGSRGQIWTNTTEAGGLPGVDDDLNGFIDDIHGWDFVDTTSSQIPPGEDYDEADNDPNDFAGHGTLVAGLAGAITDNGIGAAGMSPRVRLMPLRMGWSSQLPGGGLGIVDMSYAAQSVRYATRMGARILNCSFETDATSGLSDAVTEAVQQGVLIVMAAGNTGSIFHAVQDREDVLAVGASTRTDAISVISNRGSYIDLSAPGEDVGSTFVIHLTTDSLGSRKPSYFVGIDGTSMSSPLVAGAAALVLARRNATSAPPLRPMELLFRMRESADDITALNPGETGYGEGRLNAARAVTEPYSSFARHAGAPTIGAPVVLPAHGTLPVTVWATADPALLYVDARGDTTARVPLPGLPVGSPAAASLGPGLGVGVFMATTNGHVVGLDGYGAPLPNWPVSMPATVDDVTVGVALGDVDGDGTIEVVGVSATGDMYVWRSIDGSVPLYFPLAFGVPAVGSPAISDIDGVPGAEIIVATSDNRVYVVTKTAAAVTGWPRSVGVGVRAPIVARIGSDAPEIVVTFASTIRELKPDGTTAFSRSLGAPTGEDPIGCDLDGDGVDEILAPLANGDIAAFDTSWVPLPGWPRTLPAPVDGPPVVRAIAAPNGGASTLLAPIGGKYEALAADGRLVPSYPKPGFASAFSSLADLGAESGERLLAGVGVDSLAYFLRPPFPDLAADPAASWPTARGNFARTASRLYVPPMSAIDDIPARVIDVSVTGTGSTDVQLRWTATGDSGRTGRPDSYEIRAASARIDTDAEFDASPVSRTVSASTDAGGIETADVTGLDPGATYWFAVRARTTANDRSRVSNSVSAIPGSSGPAVPIALASRSQPSGAPVSLAWTGRFGVAARITIYDVNGRERRKLELGTAPSGTAVWDGRDSNNADVDPGVYFARLTVGPDRTSTRVVLLK